jgi:hemerythrin superfamily protein
LLHEHAGLEDDYVFPDVRKFEPKMVDTLLEEHRQVVGKIAGVWKIADEVKALRDRDERIEAPAPVLQNMTRMAEKALGEDRWAVLKAKAGL